MCVRGGHAYAAEGVAAISSTATQTRHSTAKSGCLIDSRFGALDTDPLALAPHRFAQIGHLLAHDVVDGFSRRIHVLADGVGDVVEWKVVDQLRTAIAGSAITAGCSLACPFRSLASLIRDPPRSGCGAVTCPSRAFEPGESRPACAAASCPNHRANRTSSARACSEQQRHRRTDDGPEERSRQQIELLLAIVIR